ncbi:unnamed protein product [Amoebophrya sp. A25]|nr:unnamed protein product [Amoebophrya sp. A25]|eukprot:GSA25T00000295001.1
MATTLLKHPANLRLLRVRHNLQEALPQATAYEASRLLVSLASTTRSSASSSASTDNSSATATSDPDTGPHAASSKTISPVASAASSAAVGPPNVSPASKILATIIETAKQRSREQLAKMCISGSADFAQTLESKLDNLTRTMCEQRSQIFSSGSCADVDDHEESPADAGIDGKMSAGATDNLVHKKNMDDEDESKKKKNAASRAVEKTEVDTLSRKEARECLLLNVRDVVAWNAWKTKLHLQRLAKLGVPPEDWPYFFSEAHFTEAQALAHQVELQRTTKPPGPPAPTPPT